MIDSILTNRILGYRRTRQHLSLTQKFEILKFRELPENQNSTMRQFAKKLSAYFDRTLSLMVISRILRDKEKIQKAISVCDSLNLNPDRISRQSSFSKLMEREVEKLMQQ